MKNLCSVVVLLSLLIVTPAMAAPKVKIGVVDLQRAVLESKEGSAARTAVQKVTEQYNAELKAMADDIEKLGSELKNNKKITNDDRIAKEKQLQKKNRDFQSRKRDAEEDIKQQENSYLSKIVNRFSAIIEKIGEDEGYSVVVDRASVRYVSKDTDITAELVRRADVADMKK